MNEIGCDKHNRFIPSCEDCFAPKKEIKFIPRGYVDRLRWLEINNLCDPGDPARNCPVHFIPHNQFQRPSMVRMISEEEHLSILQAERDRALELERRLAEVTEQAKEWEQLANEWRADYDVLKFKYEPLFGVVSGETKPSIPHKGEKE